MTGITPMLRIQSGGTTQEFAAQPTAKPGVYRAVVTFPTAGTWNYEVFDGFIDECRTRTRRSRSVTAPRPAAAIASGWLWGAGAALLLALAVLGLDRRRRGAPAALPRPGARGMRIATAAAGGLVLAAAVMAVLAFTTGGDGARSRRRLPPEARDGLAVWVQQGCGSCHALAAANAEGHFGPDLGASLRGDAARRHPDEHRRTRTRAPRPVLDRDDARGLRGEDRARRPRQAGRVPPGERWSTR